MSTGSYGPFFLELASRLVNGGVATQSEIVSCTERELGEIEASQHVLVPQAYRDFMLVMGRGAGRFLAGSDCFYPRALKLGQYANEVFAEGGIVHSKPIFAFLVHQGYQVLHFHPDESENPTVLSYREGEEAVADTGLRFAAFVEKSAQEYEGVSSGRER